MINPSAYYFSPSAIAINLNVSAGFIASETVQVSVAAGAAVKVANQLTTQAGKVLNLGYTAALEYRTFRLSGVNTVFGYAPPSTYNFIDSKMYVYLRLDASNNGATGEVVFIPYEVDYDGKINGTPIPYPGITVVSDSNGYALPNENVYNDSKLTYYYIHIATIGKSANGVRTWETNLQTGQLETAKGNNEKGDSAWEKMFKLVNNLIQPQKPFEKIFFNSGWHDGAATIYIDRIYNTVAESLTGFASWAHDRAVATTQSITSYINAVVEWLKEDVFLRKDKDDETKYKLKMGEAEVVTNLSVGGDAEIEGDVTVGGKMKATNAEVEEDLSVGGDAVVEGDVTVGKTVKANKIVPRVGNTVEIGEGSVEVKVRGTLQVDEGAEFKGMTQHRKGLQVGTFEPGLLGTGAQIDEYGNATVESLTARSFFSAPEYRFNRITVTDGESWSTNGLGTIENVTPITRTTGYITLHLDDGEYGSVMEGDICRGIYNEMAAGVVEGGVLFDEDGTFDECGFMKRYGFFTSYFWVQDVIENEKGKCTFLYELRNASTPHPCKFMKFAQYGNFFDETRQSSSYENTHPAWYRVVYLGVNDWIIQPENISQLWGWLKGFTIKLRNGELFTFADRGVYIDKNIYFGEAITELDPATIENLKDELALYNIELDITADTITVDPTGNVLGGLWTEEISDGQTYRKYRLHTAVTAKKGDEYLLLGDEAKDTGKGEYKIHVASADCDYFVENGTVYITRIKNIKDQMAGTDDDVNFDYDAMREMKEVKVSIIIDCEGRGSVVRTLCVTVNHVDTAFISAMLDNQIANVSWNTKSGKYVGLPYAFNIKAWHNTEELGLKSLAIDGLDESQYTKEEDGEGGYTGKVTINSLPKELNEVTNVNVTFTVEYAGVVYERTLIHTINKSQDTNVYELIPSPSSINVWRDGDATDFSSGVLECQVRCTSSEDEPYMLTQQQMRDRGMTVMMMRKNDGTWGEIEEYRVGDTLVVKERDEQFSFYLFVKNDRIDEQDVLVVSDGDDGRGIAQTETEYALGDNYEEPPSAVDFNKDFPTTTEGKYVWMRQRFVYTDGSKSTWIYICTTGKPGDRGLAGQTVRLRGMWTMNTDYENSTEFIDVVLHSDDGKLYLWYKCEKSHRSGETFALTVDGEVIWSRFSQFDNLATSVLLANQGYVDILGAGRLWVGRNKYGEGVIGWLITEGAIRHTGSGVSFTENGEIYDPDGLHFKVGSTTKKGTNLIPDAYLNNADEIELRPALTEETSIERTVNVYASEAFAFGLYCLEMEASCVSGNESDRDIYTKDILAKGKNGHRIKLLPHTTYTFSMYIDINNIGNIQRSSSYIFLYSGDVITSENYATAKQVPFNMNKGDGIQRVEVTFATEEAVWFDFRFGFVVKSSTEKSIVRFDAVKLEIGNVASAMSDDFDYSGEIKKRLKKTGIDIDEEEIRLTANNFFVENNYGDETFYIDEQGDVSVAGYISEKITYINNLEDWLSRFFPISDIFHLGDGRSPGIGNATVYGNSETLGIKGFPLLENNDSGRVGFDLTSRIGKHWGAGYANYGVLDLCKCYGVINMNFQPRRAGGNTVETVVYLPWLHFNTGYACKEVVLPSEYAMAVRLAPISSGDMYKGHQLFSKGDSEVVMYSPRTSELRHGAPTNEIVKSRNVLPKGYALYFNIKAINQANFGTMYSEQDLVFANDTNNDIGLGSAVIYYYYVTKNGGKTEDKACDFGSKTIELSETNVKLYAYISINNGTYKTNAALIAEYNAYSMQFLRTTTTYGNHKKHLVTYEEMLGMLGKRFVMHNMTETDMYIVYDTQKSDGYFCDGYIALPPSASIGFTMIQEETEGGTIIQSAYGGDKEKTLMLPKLYFKPDDLNSFVVNFSKDSFSPENFGEQIYFENEE